MDASWWIIAQESKLETEKMPDAESNRNCSCQKANWPKHKPFCNMVQGKGLKNAYLTSHTRDEVERILIDSYRLRVENDHVHREEDHGIHHPGKSIEGLVWSQGDAAEDFQRWLDLAESSGTLPEWWRFEDRMECLASAVDKNDEESIFKPIDQSELITRYEGDMAIRNALCIIAELIVGYDGKGPAKDGKWFEQFQEYLDLHADERARLIQGTVDAVKEALQTHGEEFKQPT